MNNTPYEPRSPKGASAILADSGIYSPTKGRHWSMQKNLPPHIKTARAEQEAKDEVAAIKNEMRANYESNKGRAIFLVARRVAKNQFKAIGFSELFDSFDAVKAFAKGLGRKKVKMGAVVASV